jgi:hypothetical protein
MKLNRVTLTGIDERTNRDMLWRLAQQFPFAEFGVLLSQSREGNEPRYPSRAWVDDLVEFASPDLKLAGHLCGTWARDAANGSFLWAVLRNRQFWRFDRLQINGVGTNDLSPARTKNLERIASVTGKTLITQVLGWWPFEQGSAPGLEFLLDESGGEGIPLRNFSPIPPGIRGGYAGGIGPHNVRAVLQLLTSQQSDAEFWIDCESQIRTDGWFDLDKSRAVLEVAAAFVADKPLDSY